MADEFDQAQQNETADRENAIARARIAASALQGPGRDYCLECDEPIPVERRKAVPSAARCIGCQNIFERTQAHAR